MNRPTWNDRVLTVITLLSALTLLVNGSLTCSTTFVVR